MNVHGMRRSDPVNPNGAKSNLEFTVILDVKSRVKNIQLVTCANANQPRTTHVIRCSTLHVSQLCGITLAFRIITTNFAVAKLHLL